MDETRENVRLAGFDDYEVTLGDFLRGERATNGSSLLDVQRDIRIKAAYIEAIEDCDATVFPNPSFVPGYVRSYARYLGLDQDEVYAQFCAESGFAGVNSDLVRSAADKASGVLMGPALADKDDAIFKKVVPGQGQTGGIFAELSLSAIGSVLVLLALVAGLGYGSYTLLENIQRVEIAPIDRTPGALADLDELRLPGDATTEVALSGVPQEPPTPNDLERLYQPRELELPIMAARDGPIVEIDPEQSGQFAPKQAQAKSEPLLATNRFDLGDPNDPRVRERPAPPTVRLVAERPAWIRVYMADGTVLFEKILNAAETYTVPMDGQPPLLRAGNSGALYVQVDGKMLGPVGKGTSVAKNISLDLDALTERYEEVEIVPQALTEALALATNN
ncbi:MAG: helix-turn-helix domain-containing protein [Pseudomonadota bacterium]